METSRKSTAGMKSGRIDETSCGMYCQHPACWQSNQRCEKGFPLHNDKLAPDVNKRTEVNESLPEMTVYNLIEDYGEDERDRFPVKYSGRSSEERPFDPITALDLSSKTTRKTTLTPLLTPESVVKPAVKKAPPKLKVLEVQELFDLEDLESRWDETFLTKQCYVWIPNPNKKKIKKEERLAITDSEKSGIIPAKDVTEELVPEQIEIEREETRLLPYYSLPVIKSKKRQTRSRSPYGRGRPSVRSSYPQRVPFDSDGLNNLLSLPSDILMEVLEHLNESDFMSRERINDVIQDCQPPMARDFTGISIGTAEALKQKKMALLKDKKRNIRESHLMDTRPVFQLDDGFVLDQVTCVNTPAVDFESDKGPSPTLSVQGLSKHKKPLPAIRRLKSQTKYSKNKMASVSLGLPELPSGIKHTKPFTYKKTDRVDLSIGPMPTPPTSVRSSSAGGSEHGTTLSVNMDSPIDNRPTSSMKEISVKFPEMPSSPDLCRIPVASVSNDQPCNHTILPIQRTIVPTNSPTNSECGLQTIPETSARDKIVPSVQDDTERNLNVQSEALNNLTTENASTYPENTARELDSETKTQHVEDSNLVNSTYSSPDPWPQVTEAVCTPDQKPIITIPNGEQPKEQPSQSRSDIGSRESEQDLLARKIMDGGVKGVSPAPPPPSPEARELDRTMSGKPISRESAVMESVLEENADDVRGDEVERSKSTDSQTKVITVSTVVPNPQSLLKEKSFHNFVNVDIPAMSISEPVISTSAQRPKLERSVQSFVSIDIPASTPGEPRTDQVDTTEDVDGTMNNSDNQVEQEQQLEDPSETEKDVVIESGESKSDQ